MENLEFDQEALENFFLERATITGSQGASEDKNSGTKSTQSKPILQVDKYWADALEYVVLKLETAKLPGKLVLEANPGGMNQYYHLYDGSIPLSAIVESKVIHRK